MHKPAAATPRMEDTGPLPNLILNFGLLMVLDVVAQVLSLLMVLDVVASALGGLAVWVEVAGLPGMIRAA